VTFEADDENSEGVAQEAEEDKEEEEDNVFIPEAQKCRLNPEQSQKIFSSLAKEFVDTKKTKLRRCIRYYNNWNNKYTEKILFKNKKKDLEELKAGHA
jgi:hypothetical protein